jgi:arylsulfatase A-like enzyme
MMRRLAFWFGLAALLAGAASVLWRVAPFPRVRADGPNVIVYLVDTLRRDHLGVYGHRRDTSPRVDAFARDAIVFDNAYAPSSWTRPSTASLMTGLSPSRHRAIGRLDVVRPEHWALSEHFQAAGYRTLGFVTNPNVLAVWGFDQGFDSYLDIDAESLSTRADRVIDQVLRALDALAPDERFFLYVHTLDPHAPYAPPPPYDQMFEVSGDESAALYDGEIAFGDEQFGRMIDWLRQRQKYDDTLIVFLSDHGEEFLDHSGTEHGHTLFEEDVAQLLRQAGESSQGVPMGIYLAVVPDVEIAEDVPEDVRERLRGLGYLEPTSAPRGPRAHPRGRPDARSRGARRRPRGRPRSRRRCRALGSSASRPAPPWLRIAGT